MNGGTSPLRMWLRRNRAVEFTEREYCPRCKGYECGTETVWERQDWAPGWCPPVGRTAYACANGHRWYRGENTAYVEVPL